MAFPGRVRVVRQQEVIIPFGWPASLPSFFANILKLGCPCAFKHRGKYYQFYVQCGSNRTTGCNHSSGCVTGSYCRQDNMTTDGREEGTGNIVRPTVTIFVTISKSVFGRFQPQVSGLILVHNLFTKILARPLTTTSSWGTNKRRVGSRQLAVCNPFFIYFFKFTKYYNVRTSGSPP